MNPAEKIAEVIDAHTPSGAEGIVDCYCGPRFNTFREHADHVAAEVVKALGLAEEAHTNVMSETPSNDTKFGDCGCKSTSCGVLKADHKCWCVRCNPGAWWMVTCGLCGDKRCPKAVWHETPCKHQESA